MTSLILGEHRLYLADPARLDAFRRAIRAVVRPGDVVVDLGSGTGVLGVLACQAGAARVHAIDGSSMIGIAKSVAADNGLADRFTFHHGHSMQVELPELADVVVADQLGPSGVEAGVFECFADARARLLKPGGRSIPGRVALGVAGVTAPDLWSSEVGFWETRPDGIDVGSVVPYARNARLHGTSEPEQLLTEPTVLASFDPTDAAAASIRAAITMEVQHAGDLHGIAAWFDAELASGISLTNSPVAPHRIDRLHAIYPISRPVPVVPGNVVALEIRLVPAESFVRWVVKVRDADGTPIASSFHSSLEAMPLDKEVLDRGRPDATPALSRNGEVRRTILELCDGRRTVAEVEAEVLARHADRLANPEAAAAFVAQVLADDTT